MGTIWQQPSPSDFDRVEDLVAEGRDFSQAARELGFKGSSAFKRADRERHAEILELSREVRAGIANERGEKWANIDNAEPSLRIAYLKAESPAYRQGDRTQVEIGGTIVVEHEARLTLGDLHEFDRALEGSVDGTSRELPVAGHVAEPAQGELAPGGVPARRPA